MTLNEIKRRSCGTCWWRLQATGECRRMPPVLSHYRNANGDEQWISEWPFPPDDGGCGEHRTEEPKP